MPRIRYVDKKFGAASLDVIRAANAIIAEYAAQGYDLTLRQLYYQFVSRDLIPNRQSEYKRLGGIINDARLAGLIDWNAIVDRTRAIRSLSHWSDPASIIESAARSYKIDVWARQPSRVEVWIEKDALVGVFLPVCQELDVPLFSCRGYTSQSELWGAAQRVERYLAAGQRVTILHFGDHDHDPSGLDMTRDIEDRLTLFASTDYTLLIQEDLEKQGVDLDGPGVVDLVRLYIEEHGSWPEMVEIRRLALTFGQVRQYSPPPNPAKDTDARFRKYLEEYGDESWELDALEPTVLGQLVRDEVNSLVDDQLWQAAIDEEQAGTQKLNTISKRWSEIEEIIA